MVEFTPYSRFSSDALYDYQNGAPYESDMHGLTLTMRWYIASIPSAPPIRAVRRTLMATSISEPSSRRQIARWTSAKLPCIGCSRIRSKVPGSSSASSLLAASSGKWSSCYSDVKRLYNSISRVARYLTEEAIGSSSGMRE